MRPHRLLVAGCGAAALGLSAAASAPISTAATKPAAPVIRERFTLLACPVKPRTTVQLEGCAEHRVVALDRSIDALNARIFARLSGKGRAEFTTANADWVDYRDAACASESSIYAGGTIEPVAYASCLTTLDGSHAGELRATLKSLSPAG